MTRPFYHLTDDGDFDLDTRKVAISATDRRGIGTWCVRLAAEGSPRPYVVRLFPDRDHPRAVRYGGGIRASLWWLDPKWMTFYSVELITDYVPDLVARLGHPPDYLPDPPTLRLLRGTTES